MRLAMSILVRDEADIIEANIRHHAELGVSPFIVTDNSSVDGTRDILESLSQEIDLSIIDEPAKTIDQDLWVTRMALQLRDSGQADWVINNDADEFWQPRQGSLVAAVEQALAESEDPVSIGMLSCSRYNLIPSQESTARPDYQFRDNRYQVLRDWTDPAAVLGLVSEEGAVHPSLYDNGVHMMIRTLPGKVITRLEGLESVAMGNHGAKHALKKQGTDAIDIAHYPIRHYEQFEKKVVNYGSSLENNQRFSASTSRHLRHWYQCYQAGSLREEYKLMVPEEAVLLKLVEEGVVRYLPPPVCGNVVASVR
ncbi:MAG: glycosyltransferase family 2 protein [Gammaproteobacteria bacterium]|nr:glycosyltransferase family 2 protein [Gammaproteobacteria bacterium]